MQKIFIMSVVVVSIINLSHAGQTSTHPASHHYNYFVADQQTLDFNVNGALDEKDLCLAKGLLTKLRTIATSRHIGQLPLFTDVSMPARFQRDTFRWGMIRDLLAGREYDLSTLDPYELQDLTRLVQFISNILEVKVYRQQQAFSSDTPIFFESDHIDNLNVSAYTALGITPFFVTDLDHTTWEGGVSTVFINYMIAGKHIHAHAKTKLLDVFHLIIPNTISSLRLRLMTQVLWRNKMKQIPSRQLYDYVQEFLASASAQQLGTWLYNLGLDSSYMQLPQQENQQWLNGYVLFLVSAACTIGYTADQLDAFAVDLFRKGIAGGRSGSPFRNTIYPMQLKIYQKLQARGVKGYAISAGMAFLAREGARQVGLNPKYVYAAELEFDTQGVSTGKLLQNLFNYKDLFTLQVVESEHGLPIACFGDSVVSDVPMALLVDLVNRILDDGWQPGQAVLRPEFKASTSDDRSGTAAFIAWFNDFYGTMFEFVPQPATLHAHTHK